MILLAIDPATVTGWAFGPKVGAPHAGVFRLPGFDERHASASFASAYTAVRAMVAANNVEGVVIEAPGVGFRRKNNRGITTPVSAHGELMLTMLSGAMRAGAINGGAKWIKTPRSNEWRAAVLGNGYPQHPKRAAFDYCKLFGWPVAEEDAAEALCMLVWGHSQTLLI